MNSKQSILLLDLQSKYFIYLVFTIFYTVISIVELYGQVDKIVWQTTFGGNGSDEAYRTIENNQNQLVTTGITRSIAYKSEDVLVDILSTSGNLLYKWNYGGKGDDGAYSIIQTNDGGYLIGGYTQSKWAQSLGKTDGWVLKIDGWGEFQWDVILGSKEVDIIHDLAQDANGNFIVVGETEEQCVLYKLDPHGKLLWDQKFNSTPSACQSVTIDYHGNYVCTGSFGKPDYKHGFAASFTPAGKRLWNQTFQSSEINDGIDLITKSDGGYMITGTANTRQRRQDMYVLDLDEKGRSQKPYIFGGQGDDSGLSIVETFDGKYLITGGTQSHTRGARRNDLWIHQISEDYTPVWAKPVFMGGPLEDVGQDITQLRSGDILVSGYTTSGLSREGWLIRMQHEAPIKNNQLRAVQIDTFWMYDQNSNDTVNALEHNFLAFQIHNGTQLDMHGARLHIGKERIQTGLEIPDDIYFDFIPQNSTRIITVPITGLENTISGSNTLKIDLRSPSDSIVASIPFKFRSKAMPTPRLEIVDGVFMTRFREGLPDRLEDIDLKLIIKNSGEGISKNTAVRFFYPLKINPISNAQHEVGILMPGDSVEITFKFKASSIYEYDYITIYCAAFENSARFGASQWFRVKIKDFFEAKETPFIILEPERGAGDPFNQQYGNECCGPVSQTSIDAFAGTTAVWKAPDPDELGEQFSHPLDYIDLKVSIVSSDTINIADINVFIDDEPAVEGKQYYLEKIGLKQGPGVNDYRYTYTNKIKLKEGENKVYIMVRDTRTPYLYITYVPQRSNLHVFAIGVPQEDLLFTVKDANDFASAFNDQKHKLFDEVYIHQITQKDSTTTQSLRIAIEDIYGDYMRERSIKKNDAIVLFISSHGFTPEYDSTAFLIAGSDFDHLRSRSTSLNFKDEVLDIMNQIPLCRKFLFIDACYSGAAANLAAGEKSIEDPDDIQLSKAIVRLAESSLGYNTLVSCSAGEVSYEDALWGNGSFTKALKEAFADEKVEMGRQQIRADVNRDQILTMAEIYDYVRIRVPDIVKTKKPRPENLQTPYMPQEQVSEDKPFYILDRK